MLKLYRLHSMFVYKIRERCLKTKKNDKNLAKCDQLSITHGEALTKAAKYEVDWSNDFWQNDPYLMNKYRGQEMNMILIIQWNITRRS